MNIGLQYINALWHSTFTALLLGRGITGGFYLVGMRVGPHNSWLSVAIDLGLVGVGLLVALVLVGVRGALTGRETSGAVASAIAASIVAWVIHSMTTGNEFLYYAPPMLNVYTFILLGLGARLGSQTAPSDGLVRTAAGEP
jgi:O-antigen ligase